MRRATVTLAVAAIAVLAVPPASADITGQGWVEDPGTLVAEVSSTFGNDGTASASHTGSGVGAAGEVRCTYQPALDETPLEPDGSRRTAPGPGSWMIQQCFGLGGQEISYSVVFAPAGTAGVAVDPEALARQALAQLPLPKPTATTSPPAGRDQLVNLPTWLWIADAWTPRSASASLGGVTVTVTATPESVVWDMGTGDRVSCDGPGTPYDPTRPSEVQATDCSYTYRRSSAGQPGERFPVSAELRWRARWSADGVAGGGNLGTVARSSGLALRVAEAQALVTDDGSTSGAE